MRNRVAIARGHRTAKQAGPTPPAKRAGLLPADAPAVGGGAIWGRSPYNLSGLTRQARLSRQAFPDPGRSCTAGQSPAGRHKALLGACEALLPVLSRPFQVVEVCKSGLGSSSLKGAGEEGLGARVPSGQLRGRRLHLQLP